MTSQRLDHLHTLISTNRLDALVLNPGPSLVHLTGLGFHLMERPVVLFIKPHHTSSLILPRLELQKAKQSSIPLELFAYDDNPASWQNIFKTVFMNMKISSGMIGVEPTRIRFLELNFLRNAAPEIQFISAENPLIDLRICKDKDEIQNMRKAVNIAESAMIAIIPKIHAGVTEKQIAAELTMELLKAGSDPEMPFKPIVSGGPNSADPHAEPSDRPLASGDMLVIDWGAAFNGYISDLTRSFAIDRISPEFQTIGKTVMDANRTAAAMIKPGILAGEADEAARKVIQQAGYGDFFMHRLGHGIGREPHEPPYIFNENEQILKVGMTFTIEPGIYLAQQGGVRIEDDVVVTAQGIEVLSSLPREVMVLH
jgi:Xaa-Pro dipeptidase